MLAAIATATDRVTGAIENATFLERLAEPLATAAARVIGRGPVNDALSGTATGHPAHPALVLAPLGSWLSATLLDAVGGYGSRDSAMRLVGLGNLAALPAAAAGVNDWMDTKGAERRVGLVHALANVGGLVLFTSSWFARRRGDHHRGVALSLGGMALTSGAGWLGGHLAYARGVGVDTTAFQHVVDDWTDVGAEDQVQDGEPILVHANGIPVLVLRDRGVVRAIADRCTHRGGPLHEGSIQDGCVICPWHGSSFGLVDGAVVHGPATRPQPAFDVRVSSGRVEVRQRGAVGSLRTNPVA